MPTIRERDPSRPFVLSDSTADLTRPLVVQGTADEDEVLELALNFTTAMVGNLVRKAVRAEPQGGGVWLVEVDYGVADPNQAVGVDPVAPVAPGPNDPLGPDYSFGITGENLHITQSLDTRYRRTADDVRLSGSNLTVDALNQFKVTPRVASGVNLTVDAAVNTDVAPDGTAVIAAHVGKTVNVTGGVGWTPGAYTISSIEAGKWRLSASPAAVATAGGTWTLDEAVGAADVGKLVRVTGGAGWTTGLYTILAQGASQWTLDAPPAAAGTAAGVWQQLTAGDQAGAAPDHKRAIGVTKDRIEGCDVYAPTMSWSRTVPVLAIDLAYVNRIYRCVGRTNNAAFYGFARGEVLYLGCSGKVNNGRRWDVTHQFMSNPNLTNIDVTDDIIVPSKRGWDYLWVGYEPEVSGNFLLQVPKAAYVEQVYREADFGQIGIGQ